MGHPHIILYQEGGWGLGGQQNIKNLQNQKKGFILLDPTVIFKMIPTDPQYQQKISNVRICMI